MSDFQSITSGVPQGSILGPLLFILLVNDFPSTAHCTLLMYADDTVLFYSAKDVNVIEEKLNENLGLIGNWLRKNPCLLTREKLNVYCLELPESYRTLKVFVFI